jgi:hypothetical protein
MEAYSSIGDAKAAVVSEQFKCFYCDERFSNRIERINHREQYHPDKLNYPTKDSFDNRLDR